jgi:hypothetical protein
VVLLIHKEKVMAKKPAKDYKYTKVKDPRPKTHAERKVEKYKKYVQQTEEE